jgi:hypothetical protein
LVTRDDNGLHRVCKPFRPVQALPAISPGQREINSHRTHHHVADDTATATSTFARGHRTAAIAWSPSTKTLNGQGRMSKKRPQRGGTC